MSSDPSCPSPVRGCVLRVLAMRTAKVRALDGRWRNWAPSWLASHRPSRLALPKPPGAAATRRCAHCPARRQVARDDLKKRIATAAIAFRGYDASNLGRSPELLEHPVYGPIVRAMLDSASALCSDVLGEKVDLAARVLAGEPSDPRHLRPGYRHDRRHGAGPDPAPRRVLRHPGPPGAADASATASASCRPWCWAACTRWSSSCRSRCPWRPTAPS